MDISKLTSVQMQQVKERLAKLGLTDIMKPEEVQEYMIPPVELPTPPIATPPTDTNKPKPKTTVNYDSVISRWSDSANSAYEAAEQIGTPNGLLRDTTINFNSLKTSQKKEALEDIDNALNAGEMLRRILNPNEDDEQE